MEQTPAHKHEWKISSGSNSARIVPLACGCGKRAFFKQARYQNSQKLIETANELMAFELAKLLELPIVNVELFRLDGRIGILTIIDTEQNWGSIDTETRAQIINLDDLPFLFLFDLWIANIDRPINKPEHLLVAQTTLGRMIVAVDFSHVLNGCIGEMWKLENAGNPSMVPLDKYNHLVGSEIQNIVQLLPSVARIKKVSDSTIDAVVDRVTIDVVQGRPTDEILALRANSEVVRRLLKYRRDQIYVWADEWCRTRGKQTTQTTINSNGPLRAGT